MRTAHLQFLRGELTDLSGRGLYTIAQKERILEQLSYWGSEEAVFVPSAEANCYQNYDAERLR